MSDRDSREIAGELYELIFRLERLIEAREELHRHLRFESARQTLEVLDRVIADVELEVRKARADLGMGPERRDDIGSR